MTTHARLSASGTKRWFSCPGSLPFIDQLPPDERNPSSEHAQLGTAAHALGERCLNEGHESSRHYLGWTVQVVEGSDEVWYAPGEAPEASGFYPVDDDMTDAVDTYLDAVRADLAEMGPGTELFVERRFDLSWVRPDMFGTSDATLYQFFGLLRVVDYKHGQGVPVEVEDNPQLMYYALGMAQAVDWLFDEVELVVVQPRCPHPGGAVRRWRTTPQALRDFAEKLGQRADVVWEAEEAYADRVAVYGLANEEERALNFKEWAGTYLCAGDHCRTQFCPRMNATCPAALARAYDTAATDFADAPHPVEPLGDDASDEDVARTLEWAPFLDAFLRNTEALAQRRLEAGRPVPRHKLVRGRANRAWAAGEATVVKAMKEAGVDTERLYTDPKLVSPAQAEKLGRAAKALVNGVLDKESGEYKQKPLAVKGEGKITMAHESDPRPAVTLDAGADFAGIEEEETEG